MNDLTPNALELFSLCQFGNYGVSKMVTEGYLIDKNCSLKGYFCAQFLLLGTQLVS